MNETDAAVVDAFANFLLFALQLPAGGPDMDAEIVYDARDERARRPFRDVAEELDLLLQTILQRRQMEILDFYRSIAVE